jgi:hypothetical protein
MLHNVVIKIVSQLPYMAHLSVLRQWQPVPVSKSLTQTPSSAKTPGLGFFASFPSKTVSYRYAFRRKTAENFLAAGVFPVNWGIGPGSKERQRL